MSNSKQRDEGEDEEIDSSSSSNAPTSAQRPKSKSTPRNAQAGPGPKTHSKRVAATKVRLASAKQAKISNRRTRDDGSEDSYSESDGEDDIMDGKNGILVDPRDKTQKWLKVGEDFPWNAVEWYLDDSIDEEMKDHLIKRIEKMEGSYCDEPDASDIILINPRSKKLTKERSKILSENLNVKEKCTIILPYNWLSKCYFTKKIPKINSNQQPLFLDEEGNSLKFVVMKIGDGFEMDKKRRELMVDLESNGAMIVSSHHQAQICILPSFHPYHKTPPTDQQFKGIKWHTPEWVEEEINRYEYENRSKVNKVKAKPKVESKRTESKPNSKTKVKVEKVKKENKGEIKVKLEGVEHVPYGRTEFTPEDRDHLARWLAYKRPTEVGRTTRSLYKQLDAYDRDHPFYEWARRHPYSAWHEHFKRTRSKLGLDGKILENEVNRYVKEDIDGDLRTRKERGGKERKPRKQIQDKDQNKDDSEDEEDENEVRHQDIGQSKTKNIGKSRKLDQTSSRSKGGQNQEQDEEKVREQDKEKDKGKTKEKDKEPITRSTRSQPKVVEKKEEPKARGRARKVTSNATGESEKKNNDESDEDSQEGISDTDQEPSDVEVVQEDEDLQNGQSDRKQNGKNRNGTSQPALNGKNDKQDHNDDPPQQENELNDGPNFGDLIPTAQRESSQDSTSKLIDDSESEAVEDAIGMEEDRSPEAQHPMETEKKEEQDELDLHFDDEPKVKMTLRIIDSQGEFYKEDKEEEGEQRRSKRVRRK